MWGCVYRFIAELAEWENSCDTEFVTCDVISNSFWPLANRKTDKDTDFVGKDGLIDKEDVVLIKVNAQWKYRGCANSDVIRGLIARILEHPDGFDGEIVLAASSC